jgi:ABC-type transporter MlaC component
MTVRAMTMSAVRPALLLLCLATCLGLVGSRAKAETAAAHFSGVMAELDRLSARDGLSTQARAAAFLAVMEPAFDLDAMARRALGDTLPAGPEAWAAYRRAYRAHLVHAHLRAQRLGAATSRLEGVRPLSGERMLVQMQVSTASRRQLVLWFTCPGGGTRVCDVEIDGVRLSAREQRVFRAALSRLGWEGFLDALRRGALVEAG